MGAPNDPKYAPPLLPQVVSRPRLAQCLSGDGHPPLFLVVGQAAQGKSTLVADALSGSSSPVAWLHLEPQDGDNDNFYQGLISALARALPEEQFHEFAEQAHISLGTSSASVRYEALINALWQRLPADITLVLDSLEQLPSAAPANKLCRHLIGLCAAHGRLFMVSRQTPPFKLQRWVMRQKLRTLENSELAFTAEEIADYFQKVHGYEVTPTLADHVMTVTSGWAGGLVLLSQSLNRIPEKEWPGFLSKRFPGGLSDETWLYFAEEIFDALPEKVKEMLIHAALLDVIDPDVVDRILELNSTAVTLADLAQRNLFTQAIHDAHDRPIYRLNTLFRQFLHARFTARYSTATQRKIYRRIGQFYQDHRKAEKAIRFFVKAEELSAAAACLKKAGIDLVIRGRFADLENALQALPSEQITSDPWLFFFLTLTRRVQGGVRNIEDFETVISIFEKQNDIRGQIMALAYLIEAQVFSGNAPTACGELNRKAEALLMQQGNSPYYIYARTLLWLQIGFGYIASGLEMAKGISACRNAYLLAHKIDNPRLMANANIVAVMGLAARGDFELAEEALKKIEAFADTDAYTEYHALRHLVNLELSIRRGDLDTARKQLEPLAREIETFGLLFLYPAFVDASGMLQIYDGDIEAARATCRHLLDVSRLSANAFYEGLSHRLNAMRHYFQGFYHDAAAEAERALKMLPKDTHPTLHRMRTKQLAGLVMTHLGALDRAEQRLQACCKYYSETANTLSLCETHLSLALLQMAKGEQATARHSLELGFDKAAERQFTHFTILSPQDLRRCCQWAVELPASDAKAWAEHLLTLTTASPQASRESAPGPAQEEMTDDETAPHMVINTLGGFQVMLNGRRPIDDKQWGGSRTKLFLKAILVHGIQDVPKEIIIEDLWPESRPSSALQNFKVTLHRLRKCLEPGLNRHQRSAFIHLKDNLVSLDHRRCRIDVQEFLTCCKEIKRHKLNGEIRSIGSLGERLMELYQGDFLPEDPYAPWVEMKRKALQDAFFTALMTTAEVYQAQGQLESALRCCKAVIALDPCMEQAVERMMRVCRRLGRHGEAIKAYTHLENALADDLDVAPSAALTHLYESIRNQG